MLSVDKTCIYAVAPKFSGKKAIAQKAIVGAISPYFADTLEQYEIDTFLRIAHFLAQVTHECAGFSTTEEFADGSKYEGRMDLGNTQEGDGPRYKGRGLLQLTGRANYKRLGDRLFLPLEDQPKLAADPVVSLKIACEYWRDRKINAPADNDDLITVTKKVNGGDNGLEDRRNYLKKAKAALSSLSAGTSPQPLPVLFRGLTGVDVETLQLALRKKGYLLAIDREFGAATELAVKTFQATRGIEADGIVGIMTWAALGSAGAAPQPSVPALAF